MNNNLLANRFSINASTLKDAANQVANTGEIKPPAPPAQEPRTPEATPESGVKINPLFGSAPKISGREWNSLQTFVEPKNDYKGKLGSDVAKLTAINHRRLSYLKLMYGVDISQLVNNMLDCWAGRFGGEIPSDFTVQER
jgi:hypothetical protein